MYEKSKRRFKCKTNNTTNEDLKPKATNYDVDCTSLIQTTKTHDVHCTSLAVTILFQRKCKKKISEIHTVAEHYKRMIN